MANSDSAAAPSVTLIAVGANVMLLTVAPVQGFETTIEIATAAGVKTVVEP